MLQFEISKIEKNNGPDQEEARASESEPTRKCNLSLSIF
jgi:hypothetical protein